MTRRCFAALLLAAVTAGAAAAGRLRVLNAWRTLDFGFESELTRQAMIHNGSYIPGNAVPIDVQPWQSERGSWTMLVTIPRFKRGVPATLAVVPPKGDASTPLLPFPDWHSNQQGNCDGFTSVFRVTVDACGSLWVLDTGFVDILTSDFRRICPTKLVMFNRRGEQTYSYEYPDDVLTASSLLVTIAVESRDAACSRNYAYAADVTGFGLVVLDAQHRRSWRVTANYFYPYPQWGHFNLNGDTFDLMDGVLALALGPPKADGDRDLYFHSMASNRESAVATSVLRNESLFEGGANHASDQFLLLGEPRPGQVAAEAMDVDGVMFFSVLPRNSLNCWNSRTTYGGRNLVELDRDEANLQFASGVKVIQDSKGRSHLWVLSCRFQKHMTGSIDDSEINYRILASPVDDLVRGTGCAVQRAQASRPQPQQQRPSYGGHGSGGSGAHSSGSGGGYYDAWLSLMVGWCRDQAATHSSGKHCQLSGCPRTPVTSAPYASSFSSSSSSSSSRVRWPPPEEYRAATVSPLQLRRDTRHIFPDTSANSHSSLCCICLP